MMSTSWTKALNECQQRGDAFALATILGCKGSTPRNEASKMVVTQDETFDSIGGGHLEFAVTRHVRKLLAKGGRHQEIVHFPLGASLGQCCGGSATVLIETFPACAFQIALFGAGHVAQALIPILGGLDCQVRWIDSRPDLLSSSPLPANVQIYYTNDSVAEVAQLADHTFILVLSHSHQLDFEITQASLQSDRFDYVGLIGSKTKANRFRARLAQRGITEAQLTPLKCPIGMDVIPGKLPMEVAVSIAGELIALHHKTSAPEKPLSTLSWQAVKATLNQPVDSSQKGYRMTLTEESPEKHTQNEHH